MTEIERREMEQEAHLFACLLLIPEQCLKEDLKKGFDLCDDDRLKQLANKYQVPVNAMLFRIQFYYRNKQSSY